MKYEVLAPIYDQLMSHVEYDDWVDLLEKINKKYQKKKGPISVLELGGGTGVLGEKLKHKGFSYMGSDLSFSMSKQAIKRKIPFVCSDARKIPFKKKFDFIIFLYDGINYLGTIDDYTVLFHEAANNLNDGGMFLFDITTESNSMNHFYDYLDYEDYENCTVIRHSYYDEITTTQFNDFTIFVLEDNKFLRYKKYKEHHEQKVFPPQLISEAIPRKLFSVVGIWDEFSMKNYSTRSERIHFLLKRN